MENPPPPLQEKQKAKTTGQKQRIENTKTYAAKKTGKMRIPCVFKSMTVVMMVGEILVMKKGDAKIRNKFYSMVWGRMKGSYLIIYFRWSVLSSRPKW